MIDTIYLVPKHRKDRFNVGKIEEFLLSKPHAFRDPIISDGGPIFICGDDVSEANALRTRLVEPKGSMPVVCLVYVKADSIVIGQCVIPEHLSMCREIAQWIISNYDVEIGDEYGENWTERCSNSLDPLYE